MKKLMTLVLIAVMVLSIAACASMGGKKAEKTQVKCPACGAVFDVPSDEGGG